MSKHYSRISGNKGLTLIEVVASIAILSTLLVGILTSHSRHLRQIDHSYQTQQAAVLLDQLLADWFSKNEPFVAGETEFFESSTDIGWRTLEGASMVDNPQWKSRILRVEAFSVADGRTLIAVDLLDSMDRNQRSIEGQLP